MRVEIAKMKRGRIACGGCCRGELGDGAAGEGTEVEGFVDAVDNLVDGDVFAVAREEAVVGEGV